MGDRCRSCKAPILWTVTEAGKRMPVDLHPTPAADGGNVAVDTDRHTASGAHPATVLGPLEVELHDGPLRLSHFVTCPDADAWRSPR